MEMCSIFADISGYTSYISSCSSDEEISNAVKALFVIRSEFNNVLKLDFGGKKIRFIGDCIHGVIAEGTYASTDTKESIKSSLLCASAIRSSFNVCKELLSGIDFLGLAIGIEIGNTPISRVGIRGEKSVRLSSSSATVDSELCQRSCDGTQTAVGTRLYSLAPPEVKEMLGRNRIISNLDYSLAPIAISMTVKSNTVAAEPEFRAFCKDD